MRKILVTGGLGYIGSHTVVELLEQNFEVVIVDDLSNSKQWILDRIKKITNKEPKWYNVDLKNSENLNLVFEENKIDGIIHFAAYKAVGESQQKPVEYYENNIIGLLNLLKCTQKYDVKSFIFSSSCTVYGQADELPITENAPLKKPESVYGKTKQFGEEIISDVASISNFNTILLRYFNPIGAHPSALIGELPLGIPNNLIPFVTQTAAGIRKELSIFGNDYPTLDGTAIRDYIYVVDLAKAHIKGLTRLLNNENSSNIEIYNLGTGKGSSVKEVVDAFENANNLKVNYKYAPRREGDITSAYADASLAKEQLNWEAKTSLEECLRTAWNWQKTL
ncbi:MAG: UDP-glucose 4-epimerase GalE [Flavobacteriales bacterium]|nr:UDP-glucose 4-epimerase GalE [Flavobacteriales bacterium]